MPNHLALLCLAVSLARIAEAAPAPAGEQPYALISPTLLMNAEK